MSNAPVASYSLIVRIRIVNIPGMLGKVTSAIGAEGGDIGAIDIVDVGREITRDISFKASDEAHGQRIADRIRGIEGVTVVNVSDRTFLMHLGGKIQVNGRVAVKTRDDLSMAYTPGVARVCMAIHHDPEKAYTLTIKQNTVAVVSDGSAVLGLGDIGPNGAQPVMEGKALIFKDFAGVDAFPLCLNTKNVDEIVMIVKAIAPVFGGINLEDISAPRCFEIEERLQRDLDIPVFHDDQHGTAVVVLAALINALKVVGKRLSDARIVFTGAGASGIATAKLLMLEGEPRDDEGLRRRRTQGRRHLHRPLGPRRRLAQEHPGDEPRSDRLRHGEPDARDHARGGRAARAGHGDRALRLPEPDQQLLLLPRLLPRHARRACPERQR